MKSIPLKKIIGGSLAAVIAVSISLPSQASASAVTPESQTSLQYAQILQYFQSHYKNSSPVIVTQTTTSVTKPVTVQAPQTAPAPVTQVAKTPAPQTAPAPQKIQAPQTAPAPVTQVAKTPAAAASPATTGNATLTYIQQVVALVNKERAAAGLSAMTGLDSLHKVAAAKATDMRTNQYFSHTSPTYGSPFDMMKAFGITYKAAGENIAMGQRTPEEVMTAWMNSPGHRKNILSKDFNYIGVGYDNNYWVQQFIGK